MSASVLRLLLPIPCRSAGSCDLARPTLFVLAVLLLSLFSCFPSVYAAPAEAGTVYPDVDFSPLKQRLVDDGIAAETIETLFNDPRFHVEPSLLRINMKQPSGKAGYDRFLGDASVRTSAAFLDLHRDEIVQAIGDRPVDPEVVVAILTVESSLGTYHGTFPLLNVYASLTLLDSDQLTDVVPEFWNHVLADFPEKQHARIRKRAARRARSKAHWAYRELRTLMQMAQDGVLNPVAVKGSWAGAYGMAQFIPSSARAYGCDGDGDGRIDLYTLPDAAASIAHYLTIHGYRPGNPAKRRKAVWHYNHSDMYVNTILALADKIAAESQKGDTP